MKERFLVTGGAGFIGSHIVERLVKDGHFVRVLDDFSSGKVENLKPAGKKIDLIRGDISSRATCLKATKGMDFILHQAALRSVPKSLDNPRRYNQVNIDGTLNMLEAARANKVRRFVFASSSSIYGEAVSFPEKETDLPRLISPYALTKLTGEYYCRIFTQNFGLATVSLRYFNVFGPRQSLDDEYAVVIPKFISCMLKDQPPPIFGTGRQSRDFTYVDNVVDANVLAARKTAILEGIFNVACGRNYSILYLVEALNRIMRKNIKPVFLAKRQGDVFKTHADIGMAKRLLGCRVEVDFLEGLRETVAYFKEKENG